MPAEPATPASVNALYTVRGVVDWLVTAPDAIPTILADRGARLANEFVAVPEGTSVSCRAHDV